MNWYLLTYYLCLGALTASQFNRLDKLPFYKWVLITTLWPLSLLALAIKLKE